VAIFPYIGLIYGRYLQSRILKWPLNRWMCKIYWLVVWIMNFIFPYIGNNDPNWRIFFRGVEITSHWMCKIYYGYNMSILKISYSWCITCWMLWYIQSVRQWAWYRWCAHYIHNYISMWGLGPVSKHAVDGIVKINIFWLVVWNILFFPYIGNVIVPTD